MRASPTPKDTFLVGIDENGLGARLGPLLVTGVLLQVDEAGMRWLGRKLPAGLRKDLDDSKRLASFKKPLLAEAWARALAPAAQSPKELFDTFARTPELALRERCPKRAEAQCWTVKEEHFQADEAEVRRLGRRVRRLEALGIRVRCVRSEVVCVRRLNDEKDAGGNRFVSDLHAMERIILTLREEAGKNLLVRCGKVGGMADYERYFGPLADRLRTTLASTPSESAYHFPGLGQVYFQKDADALHPVVMLASLVGKYLRELLMGRVARFYSQHDERVPLASGYHDPVTTRLVELSSPTRRKLGIPGACFERKSDA